MSKALLVGYSCGTTWYNVWHIEKRKVVISCHVQFYELSEAQKTPLSPGEHHEEREHLIGSMPEKTDEALLKT